MSHEHQMIDRERVAHTPRQEFQATHGFTLYTHANELVLKGLAAQSIPEATGNLTDIPYAFDLKRHSEVVQQNPAGIGLFVAMRTLSTVVPDIFTPGIYNNLEINDGDMERALPFTNRYGFDDVDFPWYFSACVANAAVDFFVGHGTIIQRQKDDFTLKDWANVIGAGWFSHLMHDLALTSLGLYESMGSKPNAYAADALEIDLAQRLRIPQAGRPPLLEFREQLDAGDGMLHATTELTKPYVLKLRHYMHTHRNGSLGCPVARRATVLPRDMVETDPHLQSLLQQGDLHLFEARSDDEVRAVQEETAIDRTLRFIANQLEQYDELYGTPAVKLAKIVGSHSLFELVLEHRRAHPVNALRRPAPFVSLARTAIVNDVLGPGASIVL